MEVYILKVSRHFYRFLFYPLPNLSFPFFSLVIFSVAVITVFILNSTNRSRVSNKSRVDYKPGSGLIALIKARASIQGFMVFGIAVKGVRHFGPFSTGQCVAGTPVTLDHNKSSN